jgi:hypothetical protein
VGRVRMCLITLRVELVGGWPGRMARPLPGVLRLLSAAHAR